MKHTRKEGKDSHRNTTFRRTSFLLGSNAARRPLFGVGCASRWLSLQLTPVRFFPFSDFLVSSNLAIVRCIPPGALDLVSTLNSPFVVEGARNVFLETVKHGEYDLFDEPINFENKDAPTTVILRLYEAYGGHAQAKLVISSHLPVLKAFTTNLLEDEDEDLYVLHTDGNSSSSESVVSLSFRGFEVKTVKLVLGTLPLNPPHKRPLVHFTNHCPLS